MTDRGAWVRVRVRAEDERVVWDDWSKKNDTQVGATPQSLNQSGD